MVKIKCNGDLSFLPERICKFSIDGYCTADNIEMELAHGDCDQCSQEERNDCFTNRYEHKNKDLLPSEVERKLETLGNLE